MVAPSYIACRHFCRPPCPIQSLRRANRAGSYLRQRFLLPPRITYPSNLVQVLQMPLHSILSHPVVPFNPQPEPKESQRDDVRRRCVRSVDEIRLTILAQLLRAEEGLELRLVGLVPLGEVCAGIIL